MDRSDYASESSVRVQAPLALGLTLLLWAGAPNQSPVADAAMRGEVDHVRELLRSGEDVNAAQGDGMTALHWAAESGNAELASMVIYAGANVSAVTRLGDYTPLHIASRSGRHTVVAVLLDGGAVVNSIKNTGSVTSLHLEPPGSVEVVEALIEAGANVNVAETRRGQTPLMFAASSEGPTYSGHWWSPEQRSLFQAMW